MHPTPSLRLRAGSAALLGSLCFVATASAVEPRVEFTNTGENCRNLLVSGDVDPVVARQLVPSRFEIGDEPTGFVELASCESGELDGQPLGAFSLAEAAVDIAAPAPVPGPAGTTGGHIYALTQLDTSARLSERKRGIGFTSELVDIKLTPSGPLATRLDATIPWATSPYTMGADVTPSGAPVPAATIVTRIWGAGPKGVIVTHNDIQRIRSGSAGVGTATFKAGTVLARLFGTTSLTGQSISGIGDFVNNTYVIEPAAPPPTSGGLPAPAAVGPPARERIRVRVTKQRRLVVRGAGKLVATVRRGTRASAPLLRTLRGNRRLTWRGRDRTGRPLRRGLYTVRVRRATSPRTLRTVRVRLGADGPTRVR